MTTNSHTFLTDTHGSKSRLTILNFNYKRLQKIADLQMTSRPPTRVFCDDSQLSILRDSSAFNLGPGSYNTPTPPLGPSYNFGYAKRFKTSPSSSPLLSQNKSTNIIRKNKKMLIHKPETRRLVLEKQINQQKLKESINKETKKIIEIDKKERIRERLDEKFNKVEFEKVKTHKRIVMKAYSALLVTVFICQEGRRQMQKLKLHKKRIQKYLFGISVICRALGKFKRSIRSAKHTIALRVLKKFMPKYIRRFCFKLHNKHLQMVSEVIDNFSKYVSISRINYMVNYQIKRIQRAVRNFLCVTNHRKHCIRLMWNKFDFKHAKIPEAVQHFYISSYLCVKVSEFVQKQMKIKNYVTFLTSDLTERKKIEGFEKVGTMDKPKLRVFVVGYVKRLIAKAHEEKGRWEEIRYGKFPIVIEKRTVEVKKPTGFKVRKVQNKGKRGTVTFKMN